MSVRAGFKHAKSANVLFRRVDDSKHANGVGLPCSRILFVYARPGFGPWFVCTRAFRVQALLLTKPRTSPWRRTAREHGVTTANHRPRLQQPRLRSSGLRRTNQAPRRTSQRPRRRPPCRINRRPRRRQLCRTNHRPRMRQTLRFGAHSTRKSIVRGQSRAFAVPRGKSKKRFWSVRVGNA